MPTYPAYKLKPYYDALKTWLLESHNEDGTLKSVAVAAELAKAETAQQAAADAVATEAAAFDYGPYITDEVQAALAADDTPAQAAALAAETAVDNEIAGRDLFERHDQENEENIAYGVIFADGKRSWLEANQDGEPTAWSAQLISEALAGTPTSETSVVSANEYGVWVNNLTTTNAVKIEGPGTWGNGRVWGTYALYTDLSSGDTYYAPLTGGTGYRLVSSPEVAAYGDSLTYGSLTPVNYTTQLQARLGVPVYNRGVSSQSGTKIAARQGGAPGLFTVSGGSIPASGSVGVSTSTYTAILDGYPGGTTTGITGTLGTVHGTMYGSSSVAYTFARTEAGSAVAAPDPLPFVPDFAYDDDDRTQIIWSGRNSVTAAVQPISDMIDYLKAYVPRFLVLSITNATDETSGTAGYTNLIARNAEIEALAPDNYVDVRSWLVNDAIYDLGLTPDSADLANMANDAPPPQIMVDTIHPIDDVYPLIGELLYAEFVTRGWA